jgi:L-lactate dehydrogenase complex protein LldF
MKGHPANATEFQKDHDYAKWHDETLWFVRSKRDKSTKSLPEWENLRQKANDIKAYTRDHIKDLLLKFEREATKKGIHVHWAETAQDHNEIIRGILEARGAQKVVKSKSMLTEECHLNPYLEKNGIEVIDSDLGERIVQLRNEPPSHIVLPAIHLKREHIGELFHEHLGTPEGEKDPDVLTNAARVDLRNRFLQADAAITGVNFAVAETGGVVVCTNEGNADMGVGLAKTHIACMGMEKLIPSLKDLSVFLRLLARSATGQAITTYSSHFHEAPSDGEMHIVIVDAGRIDMMEEGDFAEALNCIRCGACMNTCPVYRRSGGHSYEWTVPGPIGSVLAPSRDSNQHSSLPFACTLCGSCSDVCPVKIPLHKQLYTWRKKIDARGELPTSKKIGMVAGSWVMRFPKLVEIGGKIARITIPKIPRPLLYNKLNAWGKQRELPSFPEKSFKDMMRERNTNAAQPPASPSAPPKEAPNPSPESGHQAKQEGEAP